MLFPLDLRFKIIAIASQIAVRDANDQFVYYVKQKVFKLKEAVTVFSDDRQTQPLYRIEADRILDISAQYQISDASGRAIGAVRRRGMRSLWKAHYEIYRDGELLFESREENPWLRLADGFFGEIPISGVLSGYVFHPAYNVTRKSDEALVLRAIKQPAFFESSYRLEANPERLTDAQELVVLSVLMMLLLERQRG